MSSRRKEQDNQDLEMGEGTGVFSDEEESLPSIGERISVIPSDLPFKNLINNNFGNPVIGQSEDSISSEEMEGEDYLDRDDRQASSNMGIVGDRAMRK